jgi:Fe-S-cluster containining protein
MLRYDCDKCGACCKGSLLIEADDLDVLREPRLINADRHHAGKSVVQMVQEIQTEGKAILLACGSPCTFLGADNACTIYPTRPNVCVAMQAGDEQCQEARSEQGLPPLMPRPDADGRAMSRP